MDGRPKRNTVKRKSRWSTNQEFTTPVDRRAGTVNQWVREPDQRKDTTLKKGVDRPFPGLFGQNLGQLYGHSKDITIGHYKDIGGQAR